ncbi:hypothetical protein KIN20_022788 [Parelaphostrongylus tenuis]|uniref:SHSP domain-containing protein n=1 Tax=Parelaphostrongylus tenuis TaxID=148309 RepID=A0AAD5MQS0_PARTN|nr:hypothetical protein KIN20_022788 [Parelaphostrongylus tenuis]
MNCIKTIRHTPYLHVIFVISLNHHQLIEIVDDESKFTVSLDVSKFKPENLQVNIDGRRLTIEVKEELKEENGYSMRFAKNIAQL